MCPESTESAKTAKPAKSLITWLMLLTALSLGVYLRNPAVALLGGLITRLLLDANPVPRSGAVGKYSLQVAVVLLGFTLGFDRMLAVSADYGIIVAIYVLGTLLCGWLLLRTQQRQRTEAALLTSGTAICGGTAIATLAPLMNAKPHEFAIATALVFLLNVVALFTFPAIGHYLGLSQEVFGAWVALAIHDTSSVVATAALYGDEAAVVATTVKLGRTLWLIPLAFAVSVLYRSGEARLRVPGFVLLFVAAAVLSSILPISSTVLAFCATLSKWLLVLALGMIGLEIDRATLRRLSARSVLFGVGLWLIAAPCALLLVWTLGPSS